MADDQLFQSMLSLYEKASRGEVYPDAMVASESWFRFRMGDGLTMMLFKQEGLPISPWTF